MSKSSQLLGQVRHSFNNSAVMFLIKSAAQREVSIPRPRSSSFKPFAPAPILQERRLLRQFTKAPRTCTTSLTRFVLSTKAEWSTTVPLHLLGSTSSIWGTNQPIDKQLRTSSLLSPIRMRTARRGYENRVPRTADEFVEHYRKSNIWQINEEDMDAYLSEFVGKPQRASAYRDSAWAEHATTSSKESPYVISIPMQTRAVMVRRLQILKGNMGAQIATIAAFMIQSLVVGTVFLRIPNTTETFFSRGGVLYLSVFSLVST